MRIESETIDGIVVIHILERRLDAVIADDFVSNTAALLRPAPQAVVLDVSRVDFIDSRGIGAVLSTYRSLGPDGGLAITGAREAILSLFRLARLDKVIRIFATDADAIAAMRTGVARVAATA